MVTAMAMESRFPGWSRMSRMMRAASPPRPLTEARLKRPSIMVSSNNRTTEGDMFQVSGWYHDELRRTNEGWRISRRDFELLFNTSDTAGTTPMDNNARL